jgi:hypothetical protein
MLTQSLIRFDTKISIVAHVKMIFNPINLLICILVIGVGCGEGDVQVDLMEEAGNSYMPPGFAGMTTPNAGTTAGELAGTTMAGTPMAGTTMAGTTMAGTTMAGTPMAGTPMGMEVCTIGEIDPNIFNTDVAPSLFENCGSCHGPTSNREYLLPYGNFDFMPPLEGDAAQEALESALPYITPGDPDSSSLLSKAYNEHLSSVIYYEYNGPEYNTLKAWIANAKQCEIVYPDPAGTEAGEMMAGVQAGTEAGEMMAGVQAGTEAGEMMAGVQAGTDVNNQLACDLLPNGDPQNRGNGAYYQTFVDEINNILIVGCGTAGCHNTPNNGFWIQRDLACSVESNFLTSQLYITPSQVDFSPLLARAFDPDHAGYRIFGAGMSDPAFIRLRNWVISGL